MIKAHFVTVNALPPNEGMELTVKSVTPFAEQRSRRFRLQLMHDVRRLGDIFG